MRYLDDNGWPLDEDEGRVTGLDLMVYAQIPSESELVLECGREWLSDANLRRHYQSYADFEADEIALFRRASRCSFSSGGCDDNGPWHIDI